MDVAQLAFDVDTSGLVRGTTGLRDMRTEGQRTAAESKKSGGLIEKSMVTASGGINTAHKSAVNLAKGIAGVALATVGGMGMGNALGVARDFEAAMNDVEEKLNATEFEMGQVRVAVTDMGLTTGRSAVQAAEGIALMAQSGFDAADSIKLLPTVLDLASAAGVGMAQSADMIAGTMNTFGYGVQDATKIADLFAAASDTASTSTSQFAAAMVKIAPIASSMGIPIEDAAAAIGVLADNQILADVAGTALAASVTRLVNPVGDGEKALLELGLAAEDFYSIADDGQIKFVGYAGAIDLINDAGANGKDVLRIFGQEAGPKMQALVTAGGDALRKLQDKMDGASSAAEQAATQMKGLPGVIASISASYKVLIIFLEKLGVWTAVTAGLTMVRDSIRFLATDGIDFLQKRLLDIQIELRNFKTNLKFSDSIPFVALRTFGEAISSIGTFIRPLIPFLDDFGVALVSIGASATAISVVVGVLTALAGVVLSPVVLGVSAVAAGAVLLQKNWGGIQDWWSGMWKGLDGDVGAFATRFAGSVGSLAGDFVNAALDIAKGFVTSLSEGISKTVDGIKWPTEGEIQAAASNLVQSFGSVAKAAYDAFVDYLSPSSHPLMKSVQWPRVPEVLSSAATFIGSFGEVAITALRALGVSLSDGVSRAIDSVNWPSAAELARSAAGLIISFATVAASMAGALSEGLSSRVKTLGSDITWPTGAEIVAGAKSLIVAFGNTSQEMVSEFVSKLSENMKSVPGSIKWPDMNSLIESASRMIVGFAEVAVVAVRVLGSTMVANLRSWMSLIKWPSITDIIKSASKLIGGFGELSLTVIRVFGTSLGNGLKTAWSSIEWPTPEEIGRGAAELIIGFGSLAAKAIEKLSDKLTENVGGVDWEDLSIRVAAGAGTMLRGLVDTVGVAVSTFFSTLGPALWEGAQRLFESQKVKWKGLFVNMFDFLPGVGPELADTAKDAVSLIPYAAVDALEEGSPKVASASGEIADDVGTSLFDGARSWGGKIFAAFRGLGEEVPNGAADGVSSTAFNFIDEILDMADKGAEEFRFYNQIQSPSKLYHGYGEYVALGAAGGVKEKSGEFIGAIQDMADSAVGAMTVFEDGSAKVHNYGSSLDDVIRITRESAQATRDGTGDLSDWGKEQERIADVLNDVRIEQKALTIELEHGATAADVYRHETEGYDKAQAVAAVSGKAQAEAMRYQITALEDLARGISDSVVQAGSIKEAMSSIGETMKDWLRQQIAHFAQNAIVAIFTGDSTGLAQVLGNAGGMLSKFLSSAGNTLSSAGGLVEKFGGVASKALSGLGNLFGGAGAGAAAAVSPMNAAAAASANTAASMTSAAVSATGLGTSTATLGSTLSGAASAVAGSAAGMAASMAVYVAGVGYATNAIFENSKAYSDNAANISKVTMAVGLLTGGLTGLLSGVLVGNVVGKFTKGDWKTTGSGLAIGGDGSNVNAQAVEHQKREGGIFHSSDYRTIFTDLSDVITVQIENVVMSMRDTLGTQLELFGVEGGKSIAQGLELASYEYASVEEFIAGEGERMAADQRAVFERLGPEMSALFEGMGIDITSSNEVLNAAFAETAGIIATAGPAYRLAGIDLGETSDAIAAKTVQMTLALGGLEPAMDIMDIVLSRLVPSADLAAMRLDIAQTTLDDLNTTLGLSGDAAIDTREEMLEYIMAQVEAGNMTRETADILTGAVVMVQDASMESAEALRTQATEMRTTIDREEANHRIVAESLSRVGLSMSGLSDMTSGFFTVLNGEVIRMGGNAVEESKHLIELAGGIEALNSSTSYYYDNFFTASEKHEAALSSASGELDSLNEMLAENDRATITSVDGFREMVGGLNMRNEADRELYVRLMETAPAVKLLAEEEERRAGVLQNVTAAMMTLGIQFDTLSPSAVQTADRIADLYGGLDAFASATAFFAENFYTGAEQAKFAAEAAGVGISAFNDHLSTLGIGAVTSMGDLRLLREEFVAMGPAGLELVKAIDDAAPSFVEAARLERERSDNLDSMSEALGNLGISFDRANPLAVASAERMVELAGGLDTFLAQTNSFLDNFYTEAEKGQIVLGQSALEMQALSTTLSDLGIQTPKTKEEFRNLIPELIAIGPAGEAAAAQMLSTQDSFLAVSDSGKSASEILDSIPGNLDSTVIAFSGGIETFSTEVANVNQTISTIAPELDTALKMMVENTGLAGTGLVQSLSDAYTRITENTDITGENLEAALRDSFTEILDSVGIIRDKLPEEAKAGFDSLLDNAISTALGVTNSTDSMADAVEATMDSLPPTVKTSFDALLDSAGATGTGLVDKLGEAFDAAVSLSETTGVDLNNALRDGFESALGEAGIFKDDLPADMKPGFDAALEHAVSMALAVSDEAEDMADSTIEETERMGRDTEEAVEQTVIGVLKQMSDMQSQSLIVMTRMADLVENAFGGMGNASKDTSGKFDTLTGVLGTTGTTASTATGRLSGFSGTITKVGDAANAAAVRALNASIRASNSASNGEKAYDKIMSFNGVGGSTGSFATGLDRVTVPEMTAKIHYNELVMRGDVANQYRALGGTATNLPEFFGPSSSVITSSPSIMTMPVQKTESDRSLIDEIRKITKEVANIKSDNARHAAQASKERGTLAGENQRQTTVIQNGARESNRVTRQLAEAVITP